MKRFFYCSNLVAGVAILLMLLGMPKLTLAATIPIPCGSSVAGLTERGGTRNTIFHVFLTNKDGGIIQNTEQTQMADANGMASFPIVGGDPRGCDITNTQSLAPGTNTRSLSVPQAQGSSVQAQLNLESVSTDNGRLVLEDTIGRLIDRVGAGVPVRFPDLYADTNGDGVLGAGDLLYSSVDVNTYLNTRPSFSFGDTYVATNGLVAGLPGMFFSTSPISLDPFAGFVGTPYTGNVVVLTDHELTGIPEPSSALLLLTGVVLIIASSGYLRASYCAPSR